MNYDENLRQATDAEDTRRERTNRCEDCGHEPCRCDRYIKKVRLNSRYGIIANQK